MTKLNDSWEVIDWAAVQKTVDLWQREIYRESKAENIRKVRSLQRLIVNSHEAKLLATRRVTQDNTGKVTAGVDGVKRLTPPERFTMARSLRVPTAGMPLRRVWIPKRSGKLRPLGIPTIRDRCLQALLKLALEPEWEARFEPNSYGFRPGRNAHDAVREVLNCIVKGDKYVLDADISACFDTIDHDALLRKTGLKGRMRDQIASWLAAGVVDGETFRASVAGTPQGGVISPLLANIALHGLETHLREWAQTLSFRGSNGRYLRTQEKADSLHVIRYADDFVILHHDKSVILETVAKVNTWLADIGLTLSTSKTRLTHTRHLGPTDTVDQGFDGVVGFDFLGFTFKQFDTKHRSARSTHGVRLGFKSLVMPSTASVNAHQARLHTVVLVDGKRGNTASLIIRLNGIIRGWASYFGVSHANTTGHLAKQDQLLYLKLRRWAKRRTGSAKTGYNKYWPELRGASRRAFRKGKLVLITHQSQSRPVSGYVKVRGDRSPFDGDETYWANRRASAPDTPTTVRTLLDRQGGRCNACGLTLGDDDVMEVDHVVPRRRGGRNVLKNKQLLHRHCHDAKSARDGSYDRRKTNRPHTDDTSSGTNLRGAG